MTSSAAHTAGRKAVTFCIHHHTDSKGRTEHRILHGNRIIARSRDMAEIDRQWPNRHALAAIAKATGAA